ncbi:MAG TPA: 5-oxoprolinase subunit PxpA [Anaeromyxobacteraceae bacterium]|nr:5-oxoprolinase subunit PxpA [Anaeromyxobacteraceae bacterium]
MKKTCIDFNSDMGEGFGPWTIGDGVDDQIMPLISSANIATGFHAGDPNIMGRTVALAKQHQVGVGAHPGFRDLVGFGRRQLSGNPAEIVNDVVYQVGALREFARLNGVHLQHVKPHGSLYMVAARDEALSRALLEALQRIEPTLYVFCMEKSATYRLAKEMGQPVVRELYGDRDYDTSGQIVFTRRVGRLDPEQVAAKVVRACTEGKVRTVEGADIEIGFDSVCIHSDTPGALELIQATRRALARADVAVKPIAQSLEASA